MTRDELILLVNEDLCVDGTETEIENCHYMLYNCNDGEEFDDTTVIY